MKLLLLPFKLIFMSIGFILSITGSLIGIGLGLILIILGLAISLTIVGSIIGIPIGLLGLLILIKSIF